MRRIVSFACEGETLAATIDEASGKVGLLIVSGGNEIRIGAHRGMAKLAQGVAEAGFPAFRFDRRGIGDSSGENAEFRSSGPDIKAAIDTFLSECPHVEQLVCFGNCDAATALVLHEIEAHHLILTNPWVIEAAGDLPAPAAIKARYIERLRDPKAWVRLFTGAINFRKAFAGVKALVNTKPSSLAAEFADQFAGSLDRSERITILLASHDATAIAFAEELEGDKYASVRLPQSHADVICFKSASHSFAGEEDYALLKSTILDALTKAQLSRKTANSPTASF